MLLRDQPATVSAGGLARRWISYMKASTLISLLIIAVCATLAGCGALQQRTIWDKPGGTAAENDKDDRECNYDAKKVFYANINSPLLARYLGEQTFEACMESKGYTRQPLNKSAITSARISTTPVSAGAIGRFSFVVQKLARDTQCSNNPQVTLTGRGSGSESYQLTCDDGRRLSIHCAVEDCNLVSP